MTTFPLLPGCRGWARFSPDGLRRHELGRDWSRESSGIPFALWIGLNPSRAGARQDDPTVRKIIYFTNADGLQSFVLCNLTDVIAAQPADLPRNLDDLCSTINVNCICEIASEASKVIVAWGAVDKRLAPLVDDLLDVLKDRKLWCLGTSAKGYPRHPLYISHDTKLVPYRRP